MRGGSLTAGTASVGNADVAGAGAWGELAHPASTKVKPSKTHRLHLFFIIKTLLPCATMNLSFSQ
jgi:hypothetical protein